MADSRAAVVAGQDNWDWRGGRREQRGKGGEEGGACTSLVVGAGEGRGAAVARQLGSLAREGRAKDEETRTDVGDEEGDCGWEEGDKKSPHEIRLWISVNENQDWRGAIVSFQAAVIVESLVC